MPLLIAPWPAQPSVAARHVVATAHPEHPNNRDTRFSHRESRIMAANSL